jgi:phosphoribosyl 1,2-cyclic phosphodiesterase
VDAGLSGKRIEQYLSHFAIKYINGIFITHEHSDHIGGAGVMSRKLGIPIYATPKTWRYLNRHETIGPIKDNLKKVIEPEVPMTLKDIKVTAFDIPHDASQPVGYTFVCNEYKVSVATDIGHVTDTIKNHISDSHILFLESNHDIEMLRNGSYPKPLKERVMGKRGHLSNVSAGMLLSEIASEKLQYAYFFDTVRRILAANNIKTNCENGLRITVADRHTISAAVELH